MRITVDPYMTAGTIKFYVRRRVYGMPSNNDAVSSLSYCSSRNLVATEPPEPVVGSGIYRRTVIA
jgi:hypothetical protein